MREEGWERSSKEERRERERERKREGGIGRWEKDCFMITMVMRVLLGNKRRVP